MFKHFSLNNCLAQSGSRNFKATSIGLTYMLAFVGILSINLGIVNLIPIQVWTGASFFWNSSELLRGKPIQRSMRQSLT